MKKVTFLLISLMLLAPTLAHAVWWNPFTWWQRNESQTSSFETQEQLDVGQYTRINPEKDRETETLEMEDKQTETKYNVPRADEISTLLDGDDQIYALRTALNEANRIIGDLRTQISSLKSRASVLSAQLKSVQASAPASSESVDESNTSERIDYEKYTKLDNTHVYIKNPLPYFDKPLRLKDGLVVGFTPAVDPATDKSYIHLEDYTGTSTDPGELALRVDDPEDFSKITDKLKINDRVVVYGIGARSVGATSGEFKSSSGDSVVFVSDYIPVIILQRISICDKDKGCDEVYSPLISK